MQIEGLGGEVFNVASGRPQSVNNLFKALKKIMAKDIKPLYLEPRAGDVNKTHADIRKIKSLLRWLPQVDFYEGLERTVEWFKQNY